MKNIDCLHAETLILTDLDEGLDSAAAVVLEAHLSECADCRRMRVEVRELLEETAADAPPDPSEQFWARYDACLDARLRDRAASALWWKTAAAFGAAALVGIVVILGVYEKSQPTEIQPEVAIEVMENLDRVYGPTPDERPVATVSYDRIRSVLAKDREAYRETYISWFEVEEESNHLLL